MSVSISQCTKTYRGYQKVPGIEPYIIYTWSAAHSKLITFIYCPSAHTYTQTPMFLPFLEALTEGRLGYGMEAGHHVALDVLYHHERR
jgi:hypothetical protein